MIIKSRGMRKYDVHGTVPVVVTVTVEAESGDEAVRIAAELFKGVHQYAGNVGADKLIGVEGKTESIHFDGVVEFDDWTEH